MEENKNSLSQFNEESLKESSVAINHKLFDR